MKPKTKKKNRGDVIVEILLWVLSLTILCPLAVVLVNSLKTEAEADYLSLALPKIFQFQNYLEVFEKANVIRGFFNSVLITGVTACLCVLLSSMAAYVLSRNRTRSNNTLFYILLLGLVFNISMIPTIKILQVLGLMNTIVGLILVYVATSVSFCVFLYHGFIPSIPTTIDEAAIIDGCNPIQVFFRIIFPLLKPVNSTVLVAVVVAIWNEFRMPLYLVSNPKLWPITMSIYSFCGMYSSQWNLVFADVVIVTVPVAIVYLIFQKYLVGGLTTGSVKG